MTLRPNDLSSKWPHVPLGEAVEFLDHKRRPITASDRRPGPYPYYGANGKQDSVAEYLFDEPLVLLAEDGGFFDDPARGIAYGVTGKCWVNNHAHVLRPNPDFDCGFLKWHLAHYDVSAFVNGTTRAKLTKGSAERIPLIKPPLAEQRRIASILDKADEIRRKREETVALTDEVPRSAFLELFGDPVNNPKGWDVKPLGQLLGFLTSGSRGWAEYYVDAGDLFLRIQNVKQDRLDLSDVAYVRAPESAEARRTLAAPGDVLLSITADLGRTAVVPASIGRAFINQHLAILRPVSVNAEYLSAFLASEGGQRQIRRLNKGGVKAGLNFNDVRSLTVACPPIDRQRVFASIKTAVRGLEGRCSVAAHQIDDLFASLFLRAFRGELSAFSGSA